MKSTRPKTGLRVGRWLALLGLVTLLSVQQAQAEDLKAATGFLYAAGFLLVLAVVGVALLLAAKRVARKLWDRSSPEVKCYLLLIAALGFLFVLWKLDLHS